MSLSNALSYLTILPLPFKKEVPLTRSVHFFPFIGAAMGSVSLLSYLIARTFVPVSFPFLVAFTAVLVMEFLGGGVILFGLADTVETLLPKIREALKFRSINLFGLVVILFTVWLKVQSILSISPDHVLKAVFLTPIIGRATQALGLLYCRFQFVSESPEELLGKAKRYRTLFLTFAMLGLFFLFPPLKALLLVTQYAIGLTLTYRWLNSRFEGLTVQTLSSVSQLSETFFLITCSMIL